MGRRTLLLALLCWTVWATPGRVVDGDTFEARVRIWPGLEAYETVRVLDVDTPEMKGPAREAGLAAKRFAEEWLRRGDVEIRACKRDSFGRLLGTVTRHGENLAQELLRAGHGVSR